MKEILLGILAALFFAMTFILNHAMELDGGSWLWSSSLRYFFMLPFLFIIVAARKGLPKMTNKIKEDKSAWLLWSFVGFGLFYAPLTFSAGYGAGWLISGTWQFTIIAGLLVTPLFFIHTKDGLIRQKIPLNSLIISLFILVGIIIMQIPNATTLSKESLLLGILPVIIAAFAYPLGNRKMMALCNGELDTFQRVLGMTIMSLPLWIILAIYASISVGLPSAGQVLQSFIVGISSGVIATILFFIATDRSRKNSGKLAAVEATQSAEIIFVVIGEIILLGIPLPSTLSIVGLIIIILGMLIHSQYTVIQSKKYFSKKI